MRKMRILLVGNDCRTRAINMRLKDDLHKGRYDIVVVPAPEQCPREQFDVVYLEAPKKERVKLAKEICDRIGVCWVFISGKEPREDVDIIDGIYAGIEKGSQSPVKQAAAA